MKKLLAFFLFATVAIAASSKTFFEHQAGTRAAPTSSSSGMNTYQVKGMRVSVCAPSGATLVGDAGATIDIYNKNATTGLWEFNKGLQQTITVDANDCAGSPCRCQVFPDMEQVAKLGSQILPVANGIVTPDGGVDVYIQAWMVPE